MTIIPDLRRFIFLAGILLLPFLIIGLLPGRLYPTRYEIALELIQSGETRQELAEQLTGILTFQEIYPGECSVSSRLGKLITSAGDIPGAILQYKTAKEHGCLDEEGMLALFSLQQLQGFKESAATEMENWLTANPKSSSSPYELLIKQYEENRDLEQAAGLAMEWVERQPENPSALAEALHYAALMTGEERMRYAVLSQNSSFKLSDVENQIAQAILLAEGETEDVAQYRLGYAYSNIQEWRLAELCFQKSLELEPDRAEGWAYLAITLKNQAKDSTSALKETMKRAGDSDIVRSLLGLYWRDTDPNIAYVYWMKLAANQPDVPEWLIEAGSSLAQAGDIESAADLFERSISAAPEKLEIRAAFARFCLMYEYDIAGAGLEQTRAMIRLAPGDAEGYLLEGQMLLHEGDLVTAERMLIQANDRVKDSPAVYYYLGLVYQQRQDGSKARYYLELVTQMDDPMYARAATRVLQIP
jgi:tetratricopeptide (TPR) repeat protein